MGAHAQHSEPFLLITAALFITYAQAAVSPLLDLSIVFSSLVPSP